MAKVFGNIVDVFNERIYPGCVNIDKGIITSIDEISLKEVLEHCVSIPYILPGFADSHIHGELSYLIPSEYVKTVLKYGTISAVCDTSEIANICGKNGVYFLLNCAKDLPFYFGFSAPSFTEPNKYILRDIEELLSNNEITHLGEMKNFPAVILNEEREKYKILAAQRVGKPIDGHAPGLYGVNLSDYIAQGISTDHECFSLENAREKLEKGLIVQLQINNVQCSVNNFFELIEEFPDKIMFCSNTISCRRIKDGYIKKVVSDAVKWGANIFKVLRVASINPVLHYKLKTGLLRKGDSADFLVVTNLHDFTIDKVYIRGEIISSENIRKNSIAVPTSVNRFFSEGITLDDIKITVPKEKIVNNKVTVFAISCIDGDMNTMRKNIQLEIVDNSLKSNIEKDCLKLVLHDRYTGRKTQTVFLHGTGIKRGAFAISFSHDKQNILAVGASDDDIVVAINRVVKNKGGICVALKGMLLAELPLPVVGLMSDLEAENAIAEYQAVCVAISELGTTLQHPVTTLSFMAHTYMPSIKISPDGLWITASQEISPLIL